MIIVPEAELLRLPSILEGMGFRVIAPVQNNGVTKLTRLDQNMKPDLSHIRLINSPRDFLLPDGEVLYRYKSTATVTSYGLKIRFPTVEGPCPVTINAEYAFQRERLAFFAIHPCMANSIRYLDSVMLSDPPDPYYRSRREGMFIAVLECKEGDSYCFCVPTGSWRAGEGYRDLSIRKLSKEYLIVPRTRAGEEAASMLRGRQWEGGYEEAPPLLSSDFKISADEGSIEKDVPEGIERCTLCSACTVTCPTCYCSDIEEKFHLIDPSNVERVRRRTSCQQRCYSMIAGGTIFLKSKEDRYRWRLKHKFPFSEKAFGTKGCVGCGNCVAFCPAGIDMRKSIREGKP